MTLADKVTFLRVILSPVFFLLFFVPEWNLFGSDSLPDSTLWQNNFYLTALWILFLLIELTDWLDGKIARSRNEVSDFGKLLDPFCDTLVRIMYFLCFVYVRILPVVPFLVILYREFGILFIRIMMMKKGIAMGARKGGKLKAVFYMLTGLMCLFSITLKGLGFGSLYPVFQRIAIIIFIAGMAVSVVSFIDYLLLYRRTVQS